MLTAAETQVNRVRIWDAPVRVVHWSIVACVAVAWLTRDAQHLDVHSAAGYCLLLLCVFRILWGILGTRHARFRDFAHSPASALSYLGSLRRKHPRSYAGHNPAGTWSIYALLLLELAAVASGVIAIAGMHELGPLAGRISFPAADAALRAHEIAAWTMLAVIALHVSGVLVSSIAHRENLLAAMISGHKKVEARHSGGVPAHAALAAFLFAATLILFASLANFPRATESSRTSAAASAPWSSECGSCHLAYDPCLLPPRSWTALLEGQQRHFGEDLGLDARTREALLAQASSRRMQPWACWKMQESLASRTTLRITEAPYWLHAHHALAPRSFKPPVSAGKHDCAACHYDASSSIFHPRMIHLPQ